MSGFFVETWHGELLSADSVSEEQTEQQYWHLLNKDERKKANAFSRKVLQLKYIKTRGVLREILSSYLKIEAQKIIIKTAEYGKPFLAEGDLFFNLSHTGNKFVVVVSNGCEVGIDLEQLRNRKSTPALVEKCFSKIERGYWHSLSEQQKTIMFYRFWVRKEAFVKAVGRGIALGLNQCEINSENQTCFSRIPGGYGLPSNWKILDIPINQDHVCAVVMKDMDFQYKKIELK